MVGDCWAPLRQAYPLGQDRPRRRGRGSARRPAPGRAQRRPLAWTTHSQDPAESRTGIETNRNLPWSTRRWVLRWAYRAASTRIW